MRSVSEPRLGPVFRSSAGRIVKSKGSLPFGQGLDYIWRGLSASRLWLNLISSSRDRIRRLMAGLEANGGRERVASCSGKVP